MLPATEKKFIHALALAGCEYDALAKLDAAFGSFEAAWRADGESLRRAGLSEERVAAIGRSRESLNPDEEMRNLITAGIAIIAKSDADYPELLRHIASPPAALYIKGRLPPKLPHLAVVGTRKATPYGREATAAIIRELGREAKLVIVSGLAQGIDTTAHRAALDARLPTVGVLGGGADRQSFFPPENWNLAGEIVAAGGAVVSEYPPGAPPLAPHFPARNRIIAGLSRGVLIAEAPEKSGALITARLALESGRDVLAIPGQLFSPNAAGTNRLIQDGARLVTKADDIIDELGLERVSGATVSQDALTDETERTILGLLREPASVDELREHTNLPTPKIVTCLSLLELKGLVRSMGQNRFQQTRA